MKTRISAYYKKATKWLLLTSVLFIIVGLNSCNDEDLLKQESKSKLADASVLKSKAGFESYIVGLIYQFRQEWQADDKTYWTQFYNTDMYSAIENTSIKWDWSQKLTPVTSEAKTYWNWAYIKMIPMTNNIIKYAEESDNADIWQNEAEKNAVIAEAKFFRAWTYNILANLFGGVPIVDKVVDEPTFDMVRSTRQEVYEFEKSDLEFAAQWLPETVPASNEGRAVKAAAQHLLTEVCISLGKYDEAITSASELINSGKYQLMTSRFGNYKSEPGDAFSDLFKDGNYNRSSGNLESILIWQIEEYTIGGVGSYGRGNNFTRGWAPFLTQFKDPSGKAFVYNPAVAGTDTMGRGAAFVRPSNYALYDVWKDDWNDMRNSKYNMRRNFYYNNPASTYYLKKWDRSHAKTEEDTLKRVYPYSLKVEGPLFQGGDGNYKGRNRKDVYIMRLAETYLLRAEAYIGKGDKAKAVADINVVRARANATPVAAGDVSLDYILDERARELMAEEPRMRTLIRMGKLAERVRLYDIDQVSKTTVQDFNNLWPIPQDAINANTGAVLGQNPGYN